MFCWFFISSECSFLIAGDEDSGGNENETAESGMSGTRNGRKVL